MRNPTSPGGGMGPPAVVNLPPIDECLFGPTRCCPSTLTAAEEEEKENSKDYQASFSNSLTMDGRLLAGLGGSNHHSNNTYDSLYLGHWGDAAQQHDVPLAQLRRICSQGIADEGSYRGIAWRVLLGYLPNESIHKTWPKTVQPQRELYTSLISQYLANRPDPGRELRGTLSKRLQKNRNLRQNFNQLRRLDEANKSDDDYDDGEDVDTSMEMKLDDIDNKSTDTSSTASSAPLPPPQTTDEMLETIYDRLPPKFKDQWKKSGIRLDKSGSTVGMQTSQSLGMNHLAVPEKMETQEEFDIFLQDAILLEEIRKDVVRTHPDLYFFLEPQANLGLRRYAALERILFIWSKLNRGVRYVQGMNEIVGTIYYVLANDHNYDWAIHAEADTYFLFHTLMIEMRDVFVPDLDTSSTGIQGRIDNMQRLLQTHDPEVYEHLQECGIDASFFAIRWLTTLLSREFLLPDTIRLWDSMFASTHKENFLRYVCGTMVMMVREDLLKGDFSSCLRLLQSYPPANVDDILESSRSLWIYESQINIACHKGGISLHQALQTVSPPPAIIMAFGLRGGVAPRIQEQLRETAQNVQEGILGRAKRFWTGWGGNETTEEKGNAPTNQERKINTHNNNNNNYNGGVMAGLKQEEVSSTTTTNSSSQQIAPSGPRRRIWNRDRANTNESSENNSDHLATSSGDETEKVSSSNNDEPTPPPRRRIWNRGRSNTNENIGDGTPPANGSTTSTTNNHDNSSSNTDGSEAKSSSDNIQTPPRRRIWNRGGRADSNGGADGHSNNTPNNNNNNTGNKEDTMTGASPLRVS